MAIENVIALRLEALTSGFTGGLTNASKSLETFIQRNRSVGDVVQSASRAIAGLNPVAAAAAVGVIAVTGAIAKTVDAATRLGDEMAGLSQRTEIPVETLSQLKFAAEQSNTSFESVTTSLRFLQRNLGAAARGGKEANEAFASLGIKIKDASGKLKSLDAVMGEVADATQRAGSASEALALVQPLLGRGAQAAIPFFRQGAEGIRELREEADALNVTISARFAALSDQYRDNIGKLDAANQGLKNTFTEGLLPALNRLQESFIAASKNEGLRTLFELTGKAVGFLIDALNASIIAVGSFLKATAQLVFTLDLEGAFKTVEDGARAIGKAFTDSGSATQQAAGAISGAADEIETAADKIEEVRDRLATFATQIVANFSGLLSSLTGKPEQAGEQIIALAQQFGELGRKGVAALDPIIAQVAAANREGGGLTGTLTNTLNELIKIRQQAALTFDTIAVRARRTQPFFTATGEAAPTAAQGPITVTGQRPEAAEPIEGPLLGPGTQTGIEEARDRMAELRAEAEAFVSAISTGAGAIAETLVAAATGAKDAFSQLFKGLLKQIATAIIRATILAAILSLTGLGGGIGGLKGFFKNIAGFLGFAGPTAAQLPGDEGLLGRHAGARSLAGSLRGGPTLAAAGGGGAAFTVQIHEATPRTWAEITDTRISPRLRQRRDELNEDPI